MAHDNDASRTAPYAARLSVRVTRGLLRRLHAAAARRDTHTAELVRRIVADGLTRLERADGRDEGRAS